MKTLTVQGVTMPKLGFGTWELQGRVAQEMTECALAVGCRHLDTAQMYGNEVEVGAGLRASGVPREAVFLTTKIWPSDFAGPAFEAAAEASVDRLGTVPDLLLLHWPSAQTGLVETLAAAGRVVDRGFARHIGVSNFPTALLAEARRVSPVPLVCNQVEYHPFLAQEAVLRAARAADMAMVGYCPLARGRVFESPVLKRIATHHGTGPGEVALAWLLRQDGVAAIPRTANPDHVRTNFTAQDLELSEAEVLAINALGSTGYRICDFDFAPVWDAA